MAKFITRSRKETQRFAAKLAREFTRPGLVSRGAAIIALEGNLGSGKTTFTQGFARALGIKENVLSPTFVLVKIYKIPDTKYKIQRYKHLIHIDCYRLDSPKDLLHLGFKDLLKDQDAIILIEWADRIKKIIPLKNTFWIKFRHGKSSKIRIISVWNGKEI